MIRPAFLIFLVLPLAVFAQSETGQVETEDAAAGAEPVFVESDPPILDLEYPFEEGHEESEPVADDAAQQKILLVNQEMDRAEQAAGAAAAVQAEPEQWSPLDNAMRALFGLFAVLALLFVLSYVIKRFGKNTALLAGNDLAQTIGKVYLSPRASLHFVRAGGRVLVVGVTQNSISPVAEYDAEVFGSAATAGQSATAPEAGRVAESETESFLAQFKESLENIAQTAPAETLEEGEGEIAALREDVQRLQQYLQETGRGEKT